MTGRRPILLIANPVSGRKPGAPLPLHPDPDALEPGALLSALEARGLDATLHVLDELDDSAVLAARAVAEGRDVVVAGGDGTVGPVAAALCGTGATLGIIPIGSWNNIAQACRLPDTLDPVIGLIAAGDARQLDAGLAWHPTDPAADEDPPDGAQRFFEAAGVGLDAAGFGAAQLGERRGVFRALRSAWRALRRRRTPIHLVVDGRHLRSAAPAVTVCNGPYMGMGFAIAPDADASDGKLNVVVFSGMSRWDLLRHYLAVARRRPQPEPRMTRMTARRVTITGGRRVLPAHVDGRSMGTTPVRFAVEPGALRVFR